MKNLLKKQSTPFSLLAPFQKLALSPKAMQQLKGGEEEIIIHDVVDG